MGHTRTIEMLEYASFEQALYDHLRYNHYPPIIGGETFATAAIEAVVEGNPHRQIAVDRFAGRAVDVVEGWHLWPFVDFGTNDEAE